MEIDEEVRALAARQHSAVGREQVRAIGGDRWWQMHRVDRGEWRLATARVLVLVGSAATTTQRVMIGYLDAGLGMTLSFFSAAWLWGMYGFEPLPVHVTALRNLNKRAGAAIQHEPRRLFPSHLTTLHGFAVTSSVRTVFDLAGVVHPQRTKRLVHAVVRANPRSLPLFHQMLDELAVRGRPGITAMRSILETLPLGSVPAESGKELRFEEILEAAGEPGLRRQVSLGGHEVIGRVDYLDDELGIVFEIQSRDFHDLLPDDRARDVRRGGALEDIGKKVVFIPEALLWQNPNEVVRIVRAARRERRAELLVLKA